jgi:hypothetical protein
MPATIPHAAAISGKPVLTDSFARQGWNKSKTKTARTFARAVSQFLRWLSRTTFSSSL